jgi:hypothetical protein
MIATRALRAGAVCALLTTTLSPARSEPMAIAIEPDPRASWTAVNDAVMGGVSEGRMTRTPDGPLLFTGRVSLDNNGGFASVRRAVLLPADVADAAFRLALIGDGKRYKLAAYTDGAMSGQSYQAAFDTRRGVATTLTLPLAHFDARFRGRALHGAPPLRAEQIRFLGLLIADRQAGPFRLQVQSIVFQSSGDAGAGALAHPDGK